MSNKAKIWLGVVAAIVVGITVAYYTFPPVTEFLDEASDNAHKVLHLGVTLKQFEKVQSGMTYKTVRDIFGNEGKLISEYHPGANSTKVFSWKGSGSIGANASVTFQADKVVTKSHFGLK